MKNFIAAVVLLLAVSARASAWERLEGQHSGVKTSMAAAVQDARSWSEIWRRHDASNPVPEVDFSRESVVVVFLGRTQTAGMKVEVVVQKDPLDSDRLNVFYREIAAPRGFSAQVMCEPFVIVKVPRASVISVEKDGVVSTPERLAPPASSPDTRKLKALGQGLSAPKFD